MWRNIFWNLTDGAMYMKIFEKLNACDADN